MRSKTQDTDSQARRGTPVEERHQPRFRLLRAVLRQLMHVIWYVHPDVSFVVRASPAVCLRTLALSSRPRMNRLHQTNLFRQGRRYQIQTTPDGFVVMTTSKVWWHYRRRTSTSAVLSGTFETLDDESTRIHLSARVKVFYLLGVFLIPVYFTTIFVFMPWSPVFIVATLVLLYLLSWLAHRFNAALEALEMVYFVQKALEDFVQPPPALESGGADVVYDRQDFDAAWERFYRDIQEQ